MLLVVGERINASAQAVSDAIKERDEEFIGRYAREQEGAGAHFLDVSVAGSVPSGEEIEAMQWAVEVIRDSTDCGISVDSPEPAVLRAGLEKCGERPSIINSTTAEDDRLEAAVELAGEFESPLVALATGEEGIPRVAAERLASCEKIWSAATGAGMEPENLLFDPLVLPLSTDTDQALVTLETLRGIRERFPGCRTIVGLSNISFGLPRPSLLNRSFLAMSISAGIDAAILDPNDGELMAALFASWSLAGKDKHCKSYLKAFRDGELGG